MTRAATLRYVVGAETFDTAAAAARAHLRNGCEILGRMSGETRPRKLTGAALEGAILTVRDLNLGHDTPWTRIAVGVCRCGGPALDLRGKPFLPVGGKCAWVSTCDLVCCRD